MKKNKRQCEKCKREISTNNYARHFNSCDPNSNANKIKISDFEKDKDGKIKCPYCNLTFNKRGIATHVWRNHGEGKNHNPNIGYENGTRTVWNKGLTKEIDERVKKTV